MTRPTPDQVLAQRRRLLLDQDTEGFVALFAPDGVIELPFAGPELPARLDGQEAIREFTRRSAAGPIHIDDLEATAIHHTADPEVVIVELITRARSSGSSTARSCCSATTSVPAASMTCSVPEGQPLREH